MLWAYGSWMPALVTYIACLGPFAFESWAFPVESSWDATDTLTLEQTKSQRSDNCTIIENNRLLLGSQKWGILNPIQIVYRISQWLRAKCGHISQQRLSFLPPMFIWEHLWMKVGARCEQYKEQYSTKWSRLIPGQVHQLGGTVTKCQEL